MAFRSSGFPKDLLALGDNRKSGPLPSLLFPIGIHREVRGRHPSLPLHSSNRGSGRSTVETQVLTSSQPALYQGLSVFIKTVCFILKINASFTIHTSF